jgi:hypothetical protein
MTMRTDRCEYRDCNKPVDVVKLVAAAGGLDPDRAEVGLFCSKEHADRIPGPTPEAKARAKAKIDARRRVER